MEKIGGHSQRKPCAGLLSKAAQLRSLCLALSLLFCAFPLFAAKTEMIISESPFVAGERLTLSFLFYGTSPSAVSFAGEGGNIEKSFPPSFLVESVKKSIATPSRQGGFATVKARTALVAIEVIPTEAGEFSIGPFNFIAGRERVSFPVTRILVEGAPYSQQGAPLRLFWLVQERQGEKLVAPAQAARLEAGRETLIVLMAPTTAKGSVSCPAPENALLETAGVNSLELTTLLPPVATGGYSPAASYIWTPLFAGRQALPKAAFSSAEGGAVSFSEDAEVAVAAVRVDKSTQSEQEAAAPSLQPDSSPKKPDELLVRGTDSRFVANIANAASAFWDEGQHVKAAVILRAAENAFPFRKRIAEMRSASDKALMVEGKSAGVLDLALLFAPFMLVLLDLILFVALFISWATSGKKGKKPKLSFGGKKLIIACALFSAIAAGCALYGHFSGGVEEAAATGGLLRRVPDAEAAVVVALKPAAPLKIERRTQSWLYVKTPSGEAGWYPYSEIIVYKSGDLHEFW